MKTDKCDHLTQLQHTAVFLSSVCTGNFCCTTRCNFCLSYNFKIVCVNHLQFCCQDIADVIQSATKNALSRATSIARVNRALEVQLDV